MKLEEIKSRDWKEGEKVYVIEHAYDNGVVVPSRITENVFLEHKDYYTYIYDRVFLTMEDARKGFASECRMAQRVVERKIAAERKGVDEIERKIGELRKVGERVGQRKNNI